MKIREEKHKEEDISNESTWKRSVSKGEIFWKWASLIFTHRTCRHCELRAAGCSPPPSAGFPPSPPYDFSPVPPSGISSGLLTIDAKDLEAPLQIAGLCTPCGRGFGAVSHSPVWLQPVLGGGSYLESYYSSNEADMEADMSIFVYVLVSVSFWGYFRAFTNCGNILGHFCTTDWWVGVGVGWWWYNDLSLLFTTFLLLYHLTYFEVRGHWGRVSVSFFSYWDIFASCENLQICAAGFVSVGKDHVLQSASIKRRASFLCLFGSTCWLPAEQPYSSCFSSAAAELNWLLFSSTNHLIWYQRRINFQQI